jgi:hypothetical protein
MRWRNFDSLVACKNNVKKMVDLILFSTPKNVKIIRIHSAGDFFSKDYFFAWLEVACALPKVTLFGYTKHLDYATSVLPENMFLQYSFGSLDDERMLKMNRHVPTCYIGEHEGMYTGYRVVCSGEHSSHEDYHAILNHESFVISMH